MNLTKREKVLCYLLTLAVVIAAPLYFLVKTGLPQLQEQQEIYDAAKRDTETLSMKKANMAALEKAAADWEATLHHPETALPVQQKNYDLDRLMREMARTHGVEVTGFLVEEYAPVTSTDSASSSSGAVEAQTVKAAVHLQLSAKPADIVALAETLNQSKNMRVAALSLSNMAEDAVISTTLNVDVYAISIT